MDLPKYLEVKLVKDQKLTQTYLDIYYQPPKETTLLVALPC